jgi:hypothetical protein
LKPEAERVRNLLGQLQLTRAAAAALLRELAADLDRGPADADAHLRGAAEAEAARLRAQGFSVGPGPWFEIATPAAAVMLNRSYGTLKNWRSSGTGPDWRSDGAGRVRYSVVELLAWSRMVTITEPADVVS